MEIVYLDNNLVCAIRNDQPYPEATPLKFIFNAYDNGLVRLVTSKVTKIEIDKCPEHWQQEHKKTYDLLLKVEYVEAQELKGFNIQSDQFGFTSSPRQDDHPIWLQLQKIGLDPMDAHHILVAIGNKCDFFLTGDKSSILKYRNKIEKEFPPLKLMLPSELVSILSLI